MNEETKHSVKSKALSLIIFILTVLILAGTIRIFHPQFYHGNTPLHIITELFLASLFIELGYSLFVYIIDNFIKSDRMQKNKEMLSAIIAFSLIASFECRHSVTEYQYYVNIYNYYTDECIPGYVDITADDFISDEYRLNELYISRVYFDEIHNFKVIESDPIELNFGKEKYYVLLENDDKYEIEFMKQKK